MSAVPQFTLPEWLLPHVADVRTWPPVEGPNPRCVVDACDRSAASLGLCRTHYDIFRKRAQRARKSLADWMRRHRTEVRNSPAIRAPESVCWVAQCDRSALSNGLCSGHRSRARRQFRAEYVPVAPADESELDA